jgi:hypothetical protein
MRWLFYPDETKPPQAYCFGKKLHIYYIIKGKQDDRQAFNASPAIIIFVALFQFGGNRDLVTELSIARTSLSVKMYTYISSIALRKTRDNGGGANVSLIPLFSFFFFTPIGDLYHTQA